MSVEKIFNGSNQTDRVNKEPVRKYYNFYIFAICLAQSEILEVV